MEEIHCMDATESSSAPDARDYKRQLLLLSSHTLHAIHSFPCLKAAALVISCPAVIEGTPNTHLVTPGMDARRGQGTSVTCSHKQEQTKGNGLERYGTFMPTDVPDDLPWHQPTSTGREADQLMDPATGCPFLLFEPSSPFLPLLPMLGPLPRCPAHNGPDPGSTEPSNLKQASTLAARCG